MFVQNIAKDNILFAMHFVQIKFKTKFTLTSRKININLLAIVHTVILLYLVQWCVNRLL